MAHKDNDHLTIGPAGLALIKEFEGWSPTAYKDPVGVWTIGYGTIGSEARPGRRITKKTGEELLQKELRDDERYVKHYVNVPLNQHQFDALVSFVYNVGAGNFSKSTLRRLLNKGDYAGAAKQFSRFNRATDRRTGKRVVLRGLTRRRQAESLLFSRPVSDEVPVEKLNMENQKPIDIYEDFDTNIVPDEPEWKGISLTDLIMKSDEVKALSAALAGLVATGGQILAGLADRPLTLLTLGFSVGALAATAYFAYRDANEEA